MEKTLSVLNSMVQDGVLRQYAIGDAVAAIFYVEPINTNDLDVCFSVAGDETDLAILAPLYQYLADRGYRIQGETIDIDGWPVQFLPAFNALLDEALNLAREIQFNETVTRIMRAEHLVATMLQTGRLKDLARVQQFLEHEVIDEAKLLDVLTRHGLTDKWSAFKQRGNYEDVP